MEIAGITIGSTPHHSVYFQMYSNETDEMKIELPDAENFSYNALLTLETDFGKSITTSEYFIADKPSETIALAPQSNKTSTFRIPPLKADDLPYRELTLRVTVGYHMCSMHEILLEVTLRTLRCYLPLLTPQALAFITIAFTIGIACGILIFYKSRSRKQGKHIIGEVSK
ncbi:MAG: hypothetical protein OEY88_03865 [Candidatus Bathyarchaeota archaeon]|nr:hypothetical protein [Candidatus Bathyarchaeota archaeon]